MTQKTINNLYLSDNDITTSYYDQLSHKDKKDFLHNENFDKGTLIDTLDLIIAIIAGIISSFKELIYLLLTIIVTISGIKFVDITTKRLADSKENDASSYSGLQSALIDSTDFFAKFMTIIMIIISFIVCIILCMQLLNKLVNGKLYNEKIFNMIYSFLYKIFIKPLEVIKLKIQGNSILKNITSNEEEALLNQLNTRYYDLDNKKVVLLHQIMCDAQYNSEHKQYTFNILPEFDNYISERLINFALTKDQKELIELLELYIKNYELKKENVIHKLKNELKITKLNDKQALLDYYNNKNEQISSQLKEIYENADDVEFIKAKYDLLK